MVQEVRHLFFTSQEIVDALDAYRGMHEAFLPSGDITLKGVAKDGAVRVEVRMVYGVRVQLAVFDIAANDVLRALICACRGLGIPLPKEGKKSLSGSAAGVALKIKVDIATRSVGNMVQLDTFETARQLEAS
ncbi:MAG: hypothetical protein AAFX08_07470 [Pseudomonadota bacterium]